MGKISINEEIDEREELKKNVPRFNSNITWPTLLNKNLCSSPPEQGLIKTSSRSWKNRSEICIWTFVRHWPILASKQKPVPVSLIGLKSVSLGEISHSGEFSQSFLKINFHKSCFNINLQIKVNHSQRNRKSRLYPPQKHTLIHEEGILHSVASSASLDTSQSIDRCEASNEKIEGNGVEGLRHYDDCGGNWSV